MTEEIRVSMTTEDYVASYIKLRDKKASLKAEYDAKVEGIEKLLDQVEAKFLDHFNKSGELSIKTPAGTVYRATRTSATVADWDVILGFIRKNENWQLLERRVSKKAVEEMKAETGELPPGINWSEEAVVNFRR